MIGERTGLRWGSAAVARTAAVGVIAAALAVLYGWWGGVRSVDDGSALAIVAGAAALATVGLTAAVVGMSRGSRLVTGSGLVVAGLAAPTGFAYVANLVALICGNVLLVSGWRARPS